MAGTARIELAGVQVICSQAKAKVELAGMQIVCAKATPRIELAGVQVQWDTYVEGGSEAGPSFWLGTHF